MCYLIASSCSCSENHAQYTSEEPTVFAPAHSNLFSLSFLHTVTIPPGRREEPLVYFNLNPSGWRYTFLSFLAGAVFYHYNVSSHYICQSVSSKGLQRIVCCFHFICAYLYLGLGGCQSKAPNSVYALF